MRRMMGGEPPRQEPARERVMNETTAIAIFGATGDLAQKMLFPSLYFLDADGFLPAGLEILGTARNDLDFTAKVKDSVKERAGADFSDEAWARFEKRLSYLAGDVNQDDLYRELAGRLKDRGVV